MQKISIIVPTWNEEGNIGLLIERINNAMYYHQLTYEIIVIDDHSTDNTRSIVKHFAYRFPVKLYTKKGQHGKAQSLLEGFKYAQYDLLAMIDADLQYPPESIPAMVKKISSGVDIVVANRIFENTSFIRTVFSKTFLYLFGKMLHGLHVDFQSGLKVFKKEIIERMRIHPSPWTFDLEFLIKSIDAGYKVDEVKIHFAKRRAGKTKINLLKATYEIGLHAIKMKFRRKEILLLPPNNTDHTFTTLPPKETVSQQITFLQIFFVLMYFLSLAGGLMRNANEQATN